MRDTCVLMVTKLYKHSTNRTDNIYDGNFVNVNEPAIILFALLVLLVVCA